MAGPSVMVRVLGDVTGLAKSFTDSGGSAESAAGKAKAAFSNMLGLLNQSGVLGPFGEALNVASDSMSKLAEHGKSVSDVMLGAGSGLLAVGGIATALGSKEQAAHQQLAQAISNTGKSYDDYAKQIDEAAKHNEKFGDSTVATQNALQVLTQATGDPTKALQLLGTATDLAAAKHEDLTTAATAVGKVYNGNTKLLKEFGVQVAATSNVTKQLATDTKAAETADKNLATAKQKLVDIEAVDATKKSLTVAEAIQLRNAQQAVTDATTKATDAHQSLAAAQTAAATATTGHQAAIDQLSAKLKGQAAASADTFTGHLKAIKTEMEDQAAKMGQKYGPALTGIGAGLTALSTISKLGSSALEAFRGAQEAATVATEAQTAATDAAAVSEGLALGPILLIVAGIAALVAAAYLLYTNWTTIWGGIKDAVSAVWDWIKNNWPLLLDILLGPLGFVVGWVIGNWHKISDAFADTVNVIKGIWGGLVSFFSGLGGDIERIFSTVWSGISTAFKAVINGVIDIWNLLHFTLPKVDVLGVHVGGETIGVPTIPHLAAGGLITATGLAVVHAGEQVVPAKTAPLAGVHIENVNVHDGADVDLLLTKLRFATMAGRL